eukprot:GHVU01231286.1.p1 GENE.GHVU01231286.1~~GHVU01231286.1.p1  ORF type:complete len:750 (-),score=74.81 GHVU01231286.1:231-2339(-)
MGMQGARRILASLAFDATRVPRRQELSTAYNVTVGGAHPAHLLPVNRHSSPMNSDQLASEVKCFLLATQNVVSGLSPVRMVAARPQTANQPSVEYNRMVVNAAKNSEHMHLVSVAADGLSADSNFIREGLMDFMMGLDNCVYFVDPNHAAKAARSQVVLGSSIITMGNALVDPGLLLVAGVKKELYQVADYASDGLVLQLCSSDTLDKLKGIADSEDASSVSATALTLFFIRIFLVSVNSKLPVLDRPCMLWCALLWLTSLEGLHLTTRRNIATSILGSMFLCVQRGITAPRFCTTEPLEHTFGNLRQRRREFTVNEFIQHISRLETAFRNMTTHDVKGSGNGGGYLDGFPAYREHLASMVAARSAADGNACDDRVADAASFLVDVAYDNVEVPVSSQIESTVVTMIHAVNREMRAFTRRFECDKLSPFYRDVHSMKELAAVYLGFMGQKYASESKYSYLSVPEHVLVASDAVDVHLDDVEGDRENEEEGQAHHETNALVDLVERFSRDTDTAVRAVGDTDDSQVQELELPPLCSLNDSAVLDTFNSAAFGSLLRLSAEEDVHRVLSVATECLRELRTREPGRADALQKHQSLNGRWFGQRRPEEPTLASGQLPFARNHLLSRNDVLFYDRRYVRVLSVYKFSYRKWRLVDAADASDDTVVHTAEALVVAGVFRVNYSIPARLRYNMCKGSKVAEASVIVLN